MDAHCYLQSEVEMLDGKTKEGRRRHLGGSQSSLAFHEGAFHSHTVALLISVPLIWYT